MDNAYLNLLKQTLCASVYPESAWIVVRKPRNRLLRLLVRAMDRRGYSIVKRMPYDADRRAGGRDWPMFGYTMIGLKRLDQLQFAVETVLQEQVPGDFLEAGVWRGGAAVFMRALLASHHCTDRTVHLADSFEGMPAPTTNVDLSHANHDLSDNTYLRVSQEQVEDNFRMFGLLDEQVRFIKGWFRDTLPRASVATLAILRLDGDLYESTRDALNALYDRVSAGGFIIIDDYHNWAGCREATDEFRRQNDIAEPLIDIDGMGVYWRKAARRVSHQP